jgi:hypothetical protein
MVQKLINCLVRLDLVCPSAWPVHDPVPGPVPDLEPEPGPVFPIPGVPVVPDLESNQLPDAVPGPVHHTLPGPVPDPLPDPA